MKRREFLRRAFIGTAAIALPVTLLASRPENSIADIVRTLKERNIPPANGDYYAIVHPSDFQKLMHGEIGHYEGVRFIEQTHVPAGVPKRTHSYLDLAGNKWAWS